MPILATMAHEGCCVSIFVSRLISALVVILRIELDQLMHSNEVKPVDSHTASAEAILWTVFVERQR